MTVSDVIRAQLVMSYRIGFMAYMRNDDLAPMPGYMNHIADALSSLDVDIDALQLDVAESMTRGY